MKKSNCNDFVAGLVGSRLNSTQMLSAVGKPIFYELSSTIFELMSKFKCKCIPHNPSRFRKVLGFLFVHSFQILPL